MKAIIGTNKSKETLYFLGSGVLTHTYYMWASSFLDEQKITIENTCFIYEMSFVRIRCCRIIFERKMSACLWKIFPLSWIWYKKVMITWWKDIRSWDEIILIGICEPMVWEILESITIFRTEILNTWLNFQACWSVSQSSSKS